MPGYLSKHHQISKGGKIRFNFTDKKIGRICSLKYSGRIWKKDNPGLY